MDLNELKDEAFAVAELQGYHHMTDFAHKMMLVVTELSEISHAADNPSIDARLFEITNDLSKIIEAHRHGKWAGDNFDRYLVMLDFLHPGTIPANETYKSLVKGTVEEECADVVIRLFDLFAIYGIDIDWHVTAKLKYINSIPSTDYKKY